MEKKLTIEDIKISFFLSALWRNKVILFCTCIVSGTFSLYQNYNAPKEYLYELAVASLSEKRTPFHRATFAERTLSNPFFEYITLLNSSYIAEALLKEKKFVQRLFASEWNSEERSFFEPPISQKTKIRNFIKLLLSGQTSEKYQTPNKTRIEKFLKTQISIHENKNETITISMISSDSVLAKQTLLLVHTAAEA